MSHINLLNLGIEIGQTKRGLAQSGTELIRYIDENAINFLRFDNYLEVRDELVILKTIQSNKDLLRQDWRSYQQAYKMNCELLQDKVPLVNWGGDHSVALATVGGFCSHYPHGYVVWIDAHGDINLPEHSHSGNFHGMPLAVLTNLEGIQGRYFSWLERPLHPERLIYVGLRDLDPFERNVIEGLNIKSYTPQDIRRHGMEDIAEEIRSHIGNHPLHVSFDIDGLNPHWAPATGLHVPEGLELNDVCLLGGVLGARCQLKSVDIVEINPLIGNHEEVKQTYGAAIAFLQSVFYPKNVPFYLGGNHVSNCRSDQTGRPLSIKWPTQIQTENYFGD